MVNHPESRFHEKLSRMGQVQYTDNDFATESAFLSGPANASSLLLVMIDKCKILCKMFSWE